MARSLQSTSDQIVVEGFAAPGDADKDSASLARANRMREQLVRNGVNPNQIVRLRRFSRSNQGTSQKGTFATNLRHRYEHPRKTKFVTARITRREVYSHSSFFRIRFQ